MSGSTATVEVLTAEVRVLMVGDRQVTLSVYRQLDMVHPDRVEPFGRVHDPQSQAGYYHELRTVVGRDIGTGVLVRSRITRKKSSGELYDHRASSLDVAFEKLWDEWGGLPLIVLAGLT